MEKIVIKQTLGGALVVEQIPTGKVYPIRKEDDSLFRPLAYGKHREAFYAGIRQDSFDKALEIGIEIPYDNVSLVPDFSSLSNQANAFEETTYFAHFNAITEDPSALNKKIIDMLREVYKNATLISTKEGQERSYIVDQFTMDGIADLLVELDYSPSLSCS